MDEDRYDIILISIIVGVFILGVFSFIKFGDLAYYKHRVILNSKECTVTIIEKIADTYTSTDTIYVFDDSVMTYSGSEHTTYYLKYETEDGNIIKETVTKSVYDSAERNQKVKAICETFTYDDKVPDEGVYNKYYLVIE